MEKKWNQVTREVISSINKDVMVAVIANFEKRINLRIEQLGGHFEHRAFARN